MIYELVSLNPWLFAIALNTVLISLGVIVAKKLLTPAGWVHAWILGVLIWGCLGWRGYLIVVFYFLVGSGVTRIGKAEKEAAGIAEKRGGARGPENVWGSALTGMLCGLGVFFLQLLFPDAVEIQSWIPLLLLGYVASFSTKLSDTCGSEIGKAYGQKTFLITTLKPVPKGTEGAVSLEGTLAGVVASIVVSLLAWTIGLIDVWGIIWSVMAAFIATNLESVIGATLQTKWTWLTNEIVNFINTLIGAIVAIFFAYLWRFL
ncbi:MAG: TIGR00297 family protein [Planktothrix sp. GU0601_MAG3]|nr:MAG: TIGR00297 family protein [Planktothrix sp. GU0601_MAG3]